MRFFYGLHTVLVIYLFVLVIVLGGICFANDYILSEDISEAVTQRVLDFDNLVILPTTKTVVIRTISKDLDSEGVVVRQSAGPTIIYKDVEDNLETPENEAITDFTDFMQLLDLNKTKVKQAIRTMNTQ